MESIQKFQELLKKIFQFEASDLDLGIYRILNYKRNLIEEFIEKDLREKVEEAFARNKDERLNDINQRFEEAKQKVIQNLGTPAFTHSGDLKEEYKDTPIGKDYLSIKAQKEEVEKIDEIKNQVFSDVYNFFYRYSEKGDFASQFRHNVKERTYAFPYDSQEVELYSPYQDYHIKKSFPFKRGGI
ncbi:MAG: hypothetical protein ABIM31_03775 [candidate division WOR-3 bacterium]